MLAQRTSALLPRAAASLERARRYEIEDVNKDVGRTHSPDLELLRDIVALRALAQAAQEAAREYTRDALKLTAMPMDTVAQHCELTANALKYQLKGQKHKFNLDQAIDQLH